MPGLTGGVPFAAANAIAATTALVTTPAITSDPRRPNARFPCPVLMLPPVSTEFTARIAVSRLQPQLAEPQARRTERRVAPSNPSYNVFRYQTRVAIPWQHG